MKNALNGMQWYAVKNGDSAKPNGIMRKMERETGIGPATNSLEGYRSAARYGLIQLIRSIRTLKNKAIRHFRREWYADGMQPGRALRLEALTRLEVACGS